MHRGCATVGRVTRRASIVGLAPPPSQERRSELTDFLRNRRAQVTPQDVGLPANGRRRTPGLRREEVAQLAGVGLSWYTWLEQGRDIKPSAQVLDALARVLRLDTRRARAPLPPRPRRAAAAGRRLPARGAARPRRLRRARGAVPGLPDRPAHRRPRVERRRHGHARRADARPRRTAEPAVVALHGARAGHRAAPGHRPQHARALPRRAGAPHRRPRLRGARRRAQRGQRAVPRVVAAPRGAHRAARDEDHRASARRPPRAPPPAVGSDEPPGPAAHPVRARRRGDARRAHPPRRIP